MPIAFSSKLLLAISITTGYLICNASAATIGVNFVNDDNGGVQNGAFDALNPDELAGVSPYAQTNWNNFGRWGQTVAAIDSSGAASGVTLTWDSNNTWNNGAGNGTPDNKLMHGYLDATGTGSGNNEYSTNSGAYHFFWNENKPEVYVTGLSAWLAAQGVTQYSLVVYLDGDETSGRRCETWLANGFNGDPPTTLGSDLTTHVFLRDAVNFAGTFTQVPQTANTLGSAANGNYVVFTDLTANSFILRTEERDFHAAFLCGLQIIPTTNATPPSISTQPTSSAVYPGRTAHFVSAATGSAPLWFEWRRFGTNINDGGNVSGTKTNTLLISNVSAADPGNYTLVVTNAGGAVTSSVAALTLAASPAAGSYAHAILTNGALAHWRLNESGDPSSGVLSAFDYIGSYAGLYGTNSAPGVAGPKPATFPGFESSNAAVGMSSNIGPAYVTVPTPALNTNTATITAWLHSTNLNADGTGILLTRGNSTAGLIILDNETNRLGYTWNNDSSGTWGWNTGLIVPTNEWAFVALVIEPAKATIYLGAGGSLTNVSQVLAHTSEPWGSTAWIGRDSGNEAQVFNGMIDEVALFNRSLSFDEIAKLYGIATGISQSAPPSISSQPVSQTRYAGQTVQFAAAASGTAPLTYQWRKNGTNISNVAAISGATTDTLTLTGITAANAGDYTLFVTNHINSVTSAVATLTVVEPTTTYESRVLSLDPVAYWRLGETNDPSAGGVVAYEYWGGFSGTYASGVQNGFHGISGPGLDAGVSLFGPTNNAIQSANNVANAYVSTPALNFSGNTATLTAWVYPTAPQVNWSAMVFNRGGDPATGLNISGGGNLGYHWNDSFWDVESGLVLPNDQWSFVALVVQPDRGTLYLYNSGALQVYTNVSAHPNHTFGSGIRIGGDPQDDDRTFNGRVDEVAVFNSALSREQILALVSSGLTVSIQKSGANVIVSWPSGTLLEADDLNGPWTTNNAASPYVLSPTGGKKFFRLRMQ